MLLKCTILLLNHNFNIQKYGLSMYFNTSQKITKFVFLTPSQLFGYLDFGGLKKEKKINFIFNYLPVGGGGGPINQVTVA